MADNSPQVRLEAWRAAGTCCHSLKVTISQCRQVLDTALPLGLCISERFSNHLCCSHKSGKNKNKYESTYRLQHSHPASELIFSTNHTACNHPLQNKSPTIFSAWAKKSLFHSRFEYANAFFFFLSLPDFMIFTLHLKGKGRACALKAGLQLATNSRDRGRCSLVLPPLSGLPFKRSDSHESPKRP